MKFRCVPRVQRGVKAVGLEMDGPDEHACALGYARQWILNTAAALAGPVATEQGRAWLVTFPDGELRFTTERVE